MSTHGTECHDVAAKWCVVVTVEPPKGTEGITRHDEASLSLSTWLQRRVAGEGPLSAVCVPRTSRAEARAECCDLSVTRQPRQCTAAASRPAADQTRFRSF
eukprot:scaffold129185_cov45-Phaeocystis_antarctica.AAC.1